MALWSLQQVPRCNWHLAFAIRYDNWAQILCHVLFCNNTQFARCARVWTTNLMTWSRHSILFKSTMRYRWIRFLLLGDVGSVTQWALGCICLSLILSNDLDCLSLWELKPQVIWLHHSFRSWPSLLMHYTCFSLLGDVGIIALYDSVRSCDIFACQIVTYNVKWLGLFVLVRVWTTILWLHSFRSSPNLPCSLLFSHLGDVGIILYFGCICLSKCH